MTNYPTTLDTFQNPGPTTLMDAVGFQHDQQHSNLNDAVAALEAYLGISGSGVTTSITYLLNQVAAKVAGRTGGTLALGTNVSSGSVTGLALGFTPTCVVLTMQMPDSNGENLFPVLVGAPTSDGFNFQLDGQTDRTGYVLHYIIFK